MVTDDTPTGNKTLEPDVGDSQTDSDTDLEQGSLDNEGGEGRSEGEGHESSGNFQRLPRDFVIKLPSRELILGQDGHQRRRQDRRRLDVIEGQEEK